MITDALTTFSTAQALTTTAISTNVVDLLQNRDIGEGDDLYVDIEVGTTFTGGTSLLVQVVTADNAALTTNPVVIGQSNVVLLAALVAGYRNSIRINPQLNSVGHRFLGLNYVIVGTMTAGVVSSGIVTDIEDGNTFYASGFSVL